MCGLFIYLTPTKRKRISNQGKVSTNALQGRCKIYENETSMCCSKCEADDNIEKSIFYVTQRLIECALLNTSTHVLTMKTN